MKANNNNNNITGKTNNKELYVNKNLLLRKNVHPTPVLHTGVQICEKYKCGINVFMS